MLYSRWEDGVETTEEVVVVVNPVTASEVGDATGYAMQTLKAQTVGPDGEDIFEWDRPEDAVDVNGDSLHAFITNTEQLGT